MKKIQIVTNTTRLLLLAAAVTSLNALRTVVLNSTLEHIRDEYIVYPVQVVVFTCTTTGTNIQEWFSDEYISGVDDRIQLHERRRSGRGRAANATVINITTNELDEQVIVSQLILIASTQLPVSTVSCGNNGHRMRENITFRMQAVNLTSTLEIVDDTHLAYPHQRVNFICMTTGSNIQEWYSVEYISGVDDRIQLHEGRRSGRGRAANARVINITTNKLGEKVIVSQLTLRGSTQYPVSTVSCGKNGQGMRENITFNITDSPAPIVNSTLQLVGNACPGDKVVFMCITLDSNHHTWTIYSDNNTGDNIIDIHIRHTLPIGQPINSLKFPSASAKLVSKSEINGRRQLVSLLNNTVSENDTDQIHTVKCTDMMGNAKTISFQIIEEPCSVVTTAILNLTTTSKETQSTEIITYTASSIAVATLLAITFLISIVNTIVIYIMRRKRGKGIINQEARKDFPRKEHLEEFSSSEKPPEQNLTVISDATE